MTDQTKTMGLAELMADPAAAKLMESFTRQEDLHPDLQAYLYTHPKLGQVLQHPLVYSVPHLPMLNARMNEMYAAKKAAVETAAQERRWGEYLVLHERAWRLDALNEVYHLISDTEFWEYLGWVWTDSENIHENYDLWCDLWQSERLGREACMDEAERAALAALPETITIWRGVGHKDAVSGLSWTTDREKAVWFARRYADMAARTPLLAEGVVCREAVLAHFIGRGESEIVVLPEDVEITKIVPVEPKRRT